MIFRKIIFSLILYTISLSNLFALEPDIFVQSTVNRASKILTENISKLEKMEKLKIIAKDTVDINGIGYYTLGPARKNLSDEQKKLFQLYSNNIF